MADHADDTAIRKELREKMGWSPSALSNRTKTVRDAHLMSKQHSLYVVAYQNNVPLESYGVDSKTLATIGSLALAINGAPQVLPTPSASKVTTQPSSATGSASLTPARLFASRGFHERVVRGSRKAFNNGLRTEAIRKAFQSVNNRVRKLAHTSKDGKDLMGFVFRQVPDQTLQMTMLATESERSEHEGLRFLTQGAMVGLRNPRSHDDDWKPDQDEAAVLELLGLASWLHRCLDRCEAYSGPAK